MTGGTISGDRWGHVRISNCRHIICFAYPGTKIRILSDIFTIFASWRNKTRKVIKKAIKIIWNTVVTITIILMSLALLLQTPMVQTYIADKVINIISGYIDGNITVEKIHFKPFSNLVLKNIVITDKQPVSDPCDSTAAPLDTLFKSHYLIADFSFKSLTENEGFHLNRVRVRNAQLNLVLEDGNNGEDDITNNLTRIFRLDQIKKKEETDKEIFMIRDVDIENFTFLMKNYTSDKTPFYGGINWNDLDVRQIDVDAKNLRFKGGIMTGAVTDMHFVEKSGYLCTSLTGRARVGKGLTLINDFRLEDPWSIISMPEGRMIYSNIKAFSDYIHEVTMDVELGKSIVDFRTVCYFAPQLEGNTLRVDIGQGHFIGTVDDFQVEDIEVAMQGGGFSGTVSGRLTGIPDVDNTRISGTLTNCSLTSSGLSRFVTQWMQGEKLDLSHIASRETFRVRGKVDGTLNNMIINADINSRIGSAKGRDVRIDEVLSDTRPMRISGKITTHNLDLGKALKIDLLGPTSLDVHAEATFGDKDSPIKAVVHSLDVERLHLNGYDYSNISGEAVISDTYVDGRLTCDDPNLNFMTQGRYGLSKRNNDTKYDFVVLVGDANLNAMNIDKRGKSKVRFRFDADFTKTVANDIFGTIAMNDLFLENNEGSYNIGKITLNSINRASTYKMELMSSFAEGTYVGTAPVTEFIKDLMGSTLKREVPALFKDPSYQWNGNRYKIDFKFNNTMDILSFTMPGLYIAENTTLNANLNDRGRFNASLNSQRIAFKKQYLKDVNLSINNNDDKLVGELKGSELQVATLKLNENSLRILAEDNHIGAGYTYDNNSELENKGEFIIHSALKREKDELGIDVNLLPSMVYLNSREWRIKPSKLSMTKNGITSADVEFSSDEQMISLHGGTSRNHADTLTLELDRFDLSIVNPLAKADLGVKGSASGTVRLTSPLTSKGVLIDLVCDSTYFADNKVGQLVVTSDWDEDFERFNIAVNNKIDGRDAINATGKLIPKTSHLEAEAHLDSVNIGYLKPLLDEIFSDISGTVSGELTAEGPISNLSFDSWNTRLDDGSLTVEFTNVPYFVEGEFSFNDTGLYFDDVRGRDRYDGTAVISGGIKWDNFKDIFYDINIRCNDIEGINLTDKQNEYFYGNVFGSGEVTFIGPESSMVMDVNATTAKEGQFHVPISYTATSDRSNLLKFTEPKVEEVIDPYHTLVAKLTKESNEESEFIAKLNITAHPEVEAYIEIDKASGHMLSGRGNGTIQMEASDDVFNITGDYNISSGNYNFVALGLVKRDFQIQEGSSISFGGDIFESTLDIDAMYKTKASIGTLIADTTSISNRRTVECKIKITDKMMNPRLQFGIEIPELDPTIQSRVESALSTEDKVQKQFLSLLISNSFLPDEQSGIVNNSTVLYSNVSEVMANQLNNILEKLNIPVDLGLNYQPNEKGNDVFDVAVSTQMFNNRVVVNGSVGNKQYSENAQTDVVGDIDIEIKINKTGALRLNLFSHSADSYTNYLDNSQRSGVGLTYQTEFNTLRQFFKNLFSNKTKRKEAKQMEANAMMDGERTEIKIQK